MTKLRILFVRSWIAEDPPRTGGDQRLALLERALAAVGEVTFFRALPWGDRGHWPYYPHTKRNDWACLAAACCRNLAAHRPGGAIPAELAALQPDAFDVIFVHRLAATWWTGLSDPGKAILDLDDIPSQHFHQRITGNPLARAGKWLRYRRVRRRERRALDAFRFVLVCSEEDRRWLEHPHARVAPNCYWPSPAMDAPPPADPPAAPGAGSMLFVGSLFYRPNVTGMAWFARQVLPLIRQEVPGAAVQVVGLLPEGAKNDQDYSWADLPGVELVGTVSDVAPHIQRCRLEICPIREGGGTRIKILESLAFAKPVVSTTLGAYGQPMDESHGLIRRDDPGAFAAACIALLRDDAKRNMIGQAGRLYVRGHCSPMAMRDALMPLVETILKEAGRRPTP